MSYFLKAVTLRNWADRIEARGMLPQVIRRLVMSSPRDIDEIDFPAYESTHRAGFDGVIVAKSGNPWVPAGRSVWELSIESNVKKKADDDYSKRTDSVQEEVRRESVFVFATPRFWKGKDKWQSEKAKEGKWKNVRVYDCDDLEQWFEATSPAVVWFCGEIGLRPSGVDCLGDRWKAVAESARHALTPDVFLSGREKSVEQLLKWVNDKPNWLAIACRSPTEVIDFVCAWSASLSEKERLAFESRALLVEDLGTWKSLSQSSLPMVLVIDPSLSLTIEDIHRGVSKGHHVLLSVEPSAKGFSFELERTSQFELSQALERCGYTPVEAEQFARAAGGSLAVLKNRLAEFRQPSLPEWSQDIPIEIITSCLLLGGWSDASLPDREVFAELAGRTYDSCESSLQRMSSSRDSLLLHADRKWRLISKDEAWVIFGNSVPPSQLKLFGTLAASILTDDDPRYDLPENERPFAQISGHVSRYSDTLKQNIAETLALLGAIREPLEASASIDIKSTIDGVVASILRPTATWHRWATLGQRLALLAEASPTVFLASIRTELRKAHPELLKLFDEEGDFIFGSCNHAGLLWSLETVAWSSLHLREVAESLLLLAVQDPGGKWSNRPINSLSAIFSTLLPQTSATCIERIQILDSLIQFHREGAWTLLLELMRDPITRMIDPTHRPYWRDWANGWTRGATYQEYEEFVDLVSERVLTEAGSNVDRWVEVMQHIASFPATFRPKIIEGAELFARIDLPESQRLMLTNALSDQIQIHRPSRGSKVTLPAAFLDGLEKLLNRLSPQSEVLKSAPLFRRWPGHFLDRDGDYEANQAALACARVDAINRILNSEGFEGVLSLLIHVESPLDVGNRVAEATDDQFVDEVIPKLLEGTDQERAFCQGFIWNRWYYEKWPWIDGMLNRCVTAESKATLLVSVPFAPEAWQRATFLGPDVELKYWRDCRPFNSELAAASIEAAATALVKYERYVNAIDLLSQALFNKRDIATDCLLMSLEAFSPAASEFKYDSGQSIRYGVPRIIDELQKRSDANQSRIIQLEFRFLPLLDERQGYSPKALLNHIASNPSFFVEMLSYSFRAKSDDAQSDSEEFKRDPVFGRQIHRILHEWNCFAPMMVDGLLDEVLLRSWCEESRRIASEVGQLEHCDHFIGQFFALVSAEPDGTWPANAVCQMVEEIGTNDLLSGLSCGIYNSRGAGFRGEGGDDERKLAEKYRGYANIIRYRYPTVTKVLDGLSSGYQREAKAWDDRQKWEDR